MNILSTYKWTGPTGVDFVQEESPVGTFYHHDTPHEVRAILDTAIANRSRLRLWYGDTETGKQWNDEYDMLGYIGRSTGRIKIPLIIANSRSMGGPGILDNCIIAIATRPGVFAYKHPTLDLGKWTTGPAQSEGYLEASFKDGELIGQFKKPGQAARHCGFMTGERFAK
jgi:hypothetical protein